MMSEAEEVKPDLPEGWTWNRLGNCVEILDSQRIPINAKEREMRKGKIPYYGATGQVGWINDYIFDEELVLLGEDGAPFLDPSRNKSYIISGKSWVNNHAHVLRAINGLTINHFILHYLNIFSYQNYVTGTTRLKLNQAPMKKIPIPLAPLPEQHRIVARIEELFSRLDSGVEVLQRAKVQLQRYRKALLMAAMDGRLTEEWRKAHPEVGPAKNLLEMILRARRTKWEANLSSQGKDHSHFAYREPTPPNISRLPELPAKWCWATTEQLASTEKYSLAIGPFGSDLKVEDYRDKGVPLIFVRNIRSATFEGPDTRYISPQKAEELRAHKVESGDILITKMGEPPGDACMYPENMPTAIITADCIKWNLSQLLQEKEFFVYALNSNLVRRQILGITEGVAQQKVSLQRFKLIAIPLPPPTEEANIVAELELKFSIVNETEKFFTSSLIRADSLRRSILKHAFEGKLVPQDHSDEPASVLLKKILEEVPRKKIRHYKGVDAKEKMCSPETFDFIYPSMGHGKEE